MRPRRPRRAPQKRRNKVKTPKKDPLYIDGVKPTPMYVDYKDLDTAREADQPARPDRQPPQERLPRRQSARRGPGHQACSLHGAHALYRGLSEHQDPIHPAGSPMRRVGRFRFRPDCFMPAPFRTTRFVEFADTDMAGIAHFSAFFRWMEAAEHALLRSVGVSIFDLADHSTTGERVSMPRVSASCDYKTPARCEDSLDVEVCVMRLGATSVTYGFRFLRDGAELAVGEMTSVCCRLPEGGPPEPIPLPADAAEKLKPYAADA